MESQANPDAARQRRQRNTQVALSVVLPVAFALVGVWVFFHGRQIASLSFTGLGAGLVVFSLFLAAAALVMLFRPSKEDDRRAAQERDAHWVMLQDRKKLETVEAAREACAQTIRRRLDEAGRESAEGSLRRARSLLDEAHEGRAERELLDQRRRALVSRLSSVEEAIADAEARRACAFEEVGLDGGDSIARFDEELARASRRRRTGLTEPHRPVGALLFLVPTGVGKTELAKALAQALFGSEEALIRFDMSEFGERHTASRLTGSPPGYVGHEEGGQLTEAVRRHPYSVLLFDELEKAHPDVWNLLLQIMEDGILTDSQGRRASFGSTVLIMTSNVGGEALSTGVPLGFSGGQAGKTVQSAALQRELRQVFRPEFLGRLDEIVTFHPLDEGELETVARKLLTAFAHRLSASGIDFLPSDQAIRCLVRQGKTEQRYGARPLRRLIRTQVEDPAADLLLRQAVTAGGTLYLEEDEGQLVLSPLT